MEHDLPDELINSTDLGLPNGGDLSQLHTSLGGGGGVGGGAAGAGQDAAAKHKQLSELLRSGAPLPPTSAAGSPGNAASMGLLGGLNAATSGPQSLGPQQQHSSPQQTGMMQQAGMVGGLNRAMMGAQKGNGQQLQGPAAPGMMGGQVMNGSPRMGYQNQGMGSNSNLLADTLQQQQQPGGPPMGHAGMRPQQPGAMNKVSCVAYYKGCICCRDFSFVMHDSALCEITQKSLYFDIAINVTLDNSVC